MIDRAHLPVSKQAGVLRICHGSVYYRPRPVPEADLAIMRRLDPFAGSRMLRGLLAAEGKIADLAELERGVASWVKPWKTGNGGGVRRDRKEVDDIRRKSA